MPVTFGMVMSGIGALGKLGMGASQLGAANKINPVYKGYTPSPYAAQNLGAVQNLFYGRTPGMAAAGANLATSQANAAANLRRGSQDASTFLATAGAGQGAANKSFADLAQQEAQSKMSLLPSLTQAYGMNIAEGDKAYKDMLTKYQIDLGQKNALGQSGISNIFGGVSDIGGGAIQYGNYQNALSANQNEAMKNALLAKKLGLG